MTQEYTEPLKIQHRQILSKIEQYAAKADAVADQPARLRRQMEEMQGELDRERSDLERERLNAQALGRTVEEQLQAARLENEQLRNQLQFSNNARDAALRDLEQSSDRQRLLQRDLRSALAELDTLRLELNLLRPYEVRPLPSAAAQLEHPELEPPPSPRAPHGTTRYQFAPSPKSARARPATAVGGARPGAACTLRPATVPSGALTGAGSIGGRPPMDLGGGGGGKAGGGAGGGSDNPWDQQLLSLQRGLQKVEGLALHAQGGTPRPASARLPARSPRGGGTPRQGARRPQDPLVAALSSF